MQQILGYKITTPGKPATFVQRPDHAKYLVQKIIEKCPTNCINYKEDVYTITPARDHESCALWVVLYEAATRLVWVSRWSPYSPITIEEDHDKVKRFVVAGFFYDEESAIVLREDMADRYNYNQFRTS